MSTLNIRLFGNTQIVRDSCCEINLQPTTKTILAFLLLHGYQNSHRIGYHRNTLISYFWGNHPEKQGRRCLSTTLWRLRREIEPEGISRGTYLIASPTGEIGFNFDSDHWFDVVAFEEKIRRGLAQPAATIGHSEVQALEDAQQLYTGELLEDCYGDWIIQERERLTLLYLKCLAHLMQHYTRQGTHEKGLACGQKILAIDPLREQVHRHMMRLYLERGDRATAVQQYKLCQEILADELGIQPMPETQALYTQIVSNTDTKTAFEPIIQEPNTLQQALQQLKVAMHNLDQAQTQLHQVKKTVYRLTNQR